MFSQSLFAQLIRMTLLLMVTLYGVHQCQPLIDALAKNATSGGCHHQNSIEPQQNSPQHSQHQYSQHQHMEHH